MSNAKRDRHAHRDGENDRAAGRCRKAANRAAEQRQRKGMENDAAGITSRIYPPDRRIPPLLVLP